MARSNLIYKQSISGSSLFLEILTYFTHGLIQNQVEREAEGGAGEVQLRRFFSATLKLRFCSVEIRSDSKSLSGVLISTLTI